MLCVASRQQQAKQKLEKQLAAVVNRVLARRDPNPLLAIGLELVVMESSTAPEMGEDAGQKAERIAETLRQCAGAACELPTGSGQPAAPATADAVAGASDESLQSRFTQGADGLLSYCGLATFFGGLEAMVGPPSPKVMIAMEMEHTAAKDSKVEFTTANYGVHTSSAEEYAFVAKPDQPPEGGWPVEELLRGLDERPSVDERDVIKAMRNSGARPRVPTPLSVLEEALAEKNAQLEKIGEPTLALAEVFGARLYTGPMFFKYNSVLRGLESDVSFLRSRFEKLCLGNTYATTLHVINSAVIKLGKLTFAGKVYRGVSGRALPEEFWKQNQYGGRGGIEAAFMSTTIDRKVATQYASAGRTGFVFEMQQGMVDRGADLSWLSQYPHEKEILFGPLTALEVREMRVDDGSTLVVGVNVEVNLAAQTLEQVVGKRLTILRDMGDAAKNELHFAMKGWPLLPFVLTALDRELRAGALSQEPTWYNLDVNFQASMGVVMEAQMGALQQNSRVAMLNQRLTPDEKKRLRAAGVLAEQLLPRSGGQNWDKSKVAESASWGFTVPQLLELGYTAQELADGGASCFALPDGVTAKPGGLSGTIHTTGFTRNDYDGNMSRGAAEFTFGESGEFSGGIDYNPGGNYNPAQATMVSGKYDFAGLENPDPAGWIQWEEGDTFYYSEIYSSGTFYYSGKVLGSTLTGRYQMGGRNAHGTFEWNVQQ
jgi:hypothetical protein